MFRPGSLFPGGGSRLPVNTGGVTSLTMQYTLTINPNNCNSVMNMWTYFMVEDSVGCTGREPEVRIRPPHCGTSGWIPASSADVNVTKYIYYCYKHLLKVYYSWVILIILWAGYLIRPCIYKHIWSGSSPPGQQVALWRHPPPTDSVCKRRSSSAAGTCFNCVTVELLMLYFASFICIFALTSFIIDGFVLERNRKWAVISPLSA